MSNYEGNKYDYDICMSFWDRKCAVLNKSIYPAARALGVQASNTVI